MTSNIEVRHLTTEFEIRQDPETKREHLTGYAIRYMSLSQDLGGFKERLLPGALTRTLADPSIDIVALEQHNWEKVIGRRSEGTLKLVEDGYGLRFDILPPDNTRGRDLIVEVRDRYLKGMSFGFIVESESVINEGGEIVRELRDVTLHEISVVTNPAYLQPTVNVRAKERALELRSLSDLVLPEIREPGVEALLPYLTQQIAAELL